MFVSHAAALGLVMYIYVCVCVCVCLCVCVSVCVCVQVSIVEYFLRLSPCNHEITRYEDLEKEMMSHTSVVTAQACMEIIFRRTGPPTDLDFGRLFGFGVCICVCLSVSVSV